MKKRRHHFVWRHYLEPWTTAGQIACLRNGRIFTPGLSVVAVEKDFYRLREMTEKDVTFIRHFIAALPPQGREVNQKWLQLFDAPFAHRRAYRNSGKKSPDFEREVDRALANLEEDLHSRVESSAVALLASLRKGDSSFFGTEAGFFDFIYFLSVQYVRTKRMMSRVVESLHQFGAINIENSFGALRHIIATNMGAAFVLRRRSIWLIILQTNDESQFITGDQPVINMYAVHLAPNVAPEKIELYYPITPKLAVLIGDENDKPKPSESLLSTCDVDHYNRLIVDSSYEQVFASSENLLTQYVGSSVASPGII